MHEPDRPLQHRGLMLARQALEGLGAVERVDELWRAIGNHGGVAVAQSAQRQCEIEAGQRGAASGTPDAFGVLALQARAFAAGRELELGRVDVVELRRRVIAGALGEVRERGPRPLGQLTAQRAVRKRCRRGAQRRPVAERERHGALSISEREPGTRPRGEPRHPARFERLRKRRLGRRLEPHVLAARGDGRQHVAGAVGEQDQVHELGRLLERLEHPVGGRVPHRLGLLDHEHAPARLKRRSRRRRDHRLVDVRDEHLGDTTRRHPGEVGVGAPRDPLGGLRALGRTVGDQRGGECARDVTLTRACGTGKKIGVRGLRRRQGGEQQGLGVGVSLDPGECSNGHPRSVAAARAVAA